jgi:NAD(P)H-hydrate repair Nnr-like enzyme with NAD(P)H-hydrate dehydratase domain
MADERKTEPSPAPDEEAMATLVSQLLGEVKDLRTAMKEFSNKANRLIHIANECFSVAQDISLKKEEEALVLANHEKRLERLERMMANGE